MTNGRTPDLAAAINVIDRLQAQHKALEHASNLLEALKVAGQQKAEIEASVAELKKEQEQLSKDVATERDKLRAAKEEHKTSMEAMTREFQAKQQKASEELKEKISGLTKQKADLAKVIAETEKKHHDALSVMVKEREKAEQELATAKGELANLRSRLAAVGSA